MWDTKGENHQCNFKIGERIFESKESIGRLNTGFCARFLGQVVKYRRKGAITVGTVSRYARGSFDK